MGGSFFRGIYATLALMHQIQWYPGHMHKTRRLIAKTLPKVDVVFELLDARAPLASRNPLIKELLRVDREGRKALKPAVVLLNKSDLADPKILELWLGWFRQHGEEVLPLNALSRGNMKSLHTVARQAVAKTGKLVRDRPLRGMIVGIPNVGKSTLFNTLAGNRKALVGDKPGVTRDFQRVRTGQNLLLFDSPGVLWPKFEDPAAGIRLAALGAIKDSVLPLEEVAIAACGLCRDLYPARLAERYRLENLDGPEAELLEEIGRRRGCLIKGGRVDLVKASGVILNDIRAGRLGRVCLESPEGLEGRQDG